MKRKEDKMKVIKRSKDITKDYENINNYIQENNIDMDINRYIHSEMKEYVSNNLRGKKYIRNKVPVVHDGYMSPMVVKSIWSEEAIKIPDRIPDTIIKYIDVSEWLTLLGFIEFEMNKKDTINKLIIKDLKFLKSYTLRMLETMEITEKYKVIWDRMHSDSAMVWEEEI